MPKPISDEWEEFTKRIYRPMGHVSKTQYDESRRAFFAGAVAMFYMVADKSDELSEDAALEFFDSIQAEIKQYAEDLTHGRA